MQNTWPAPEKVIVSGMFWDVPVLVVNGRKMFVSSDTLNPLGVFTNQQIINHSKTKPGGNQWNSVSCQ